MRKTKINRIDNMGGNAMEAYSMARVSGFIRSYASEDEGYLDTIYQEAVAAKVPVIRRETRDFLKTQILIKKPMRVLEIGTAVGYSSLYMSQFLPEGGSITTIELDDERYQQACDNIKRMGKENVITPLLGDAAVVIKELEADSFDMAFVDAAKGQYINYLPDTVRLLKSEGLIISDNVLQDGEIFESHFMVEKRNRTIHDRMREYLYTITHDDNLDTAIVPVGDGVAVTVVKK